MSKPIIKAEINDNVPVLEVNVPTGNVPVLPVETIGGAEPILESLSVTENGTYAPEEGVDGFDEVSVDVPQTIIESISITENGTYTAPSGKAYSPIEVNVTSGVTIQDAELVKEIPTPIAPEVLPNGKLYLVPNGAQYCPPIPEVTGCDYAIICCNSVSVSPYNWVDKTRLDSSTKFWLYLSSDVGRCRRDAIQTISWDGGSTSNKFPDHLYEYDTSGAFTWTELDKTDPDVIDAFNLSADSPGAIIHNVLECVYTNSNIFRYTVGNLEFDMSLSILDSDCKIYNPFYINSYDCYLVINNTAVYQNTYSMYQLISNYN